MTYSFIGRQKSRRRQNKWRQILSIIRCILSLAAVGITRLIPLRLVILAYFLDSDSNAQVAVVHSKRKAPIIPGINKNLPRMTRSVLCRLSI